MIDLDRHAESILQRTLARGGDLAEIFCEETTHTSIRVEDGKVERVTSGTDAGAGIRLLAGDRTLNGHADALTEETLLDAAAVVAGGAPGGPPREPRMATERQRFETAVRRPPEGISSQEKTRLALAAEKAARAHDPRIVQVTVVYADSSRRIVIANSDGTLVEDHRPQIMFMVQAVAREGSVIQTGRRVVGGTMGFELFDEEDPEALARAAAAQACLMLGARPAPTGKMPVVLSSEAGGTMVHEAVGHGLEADAIDRNMSKYCGQIGQLIAAPHVTVVDDGTLPFKRGTAHVDDEGTPAQRTVLIENGVLLRYMNDLRTARKMGHAPTGNGRRQSCRHRPVPHMTNTLILPGTEDPDAILADTPRGLFVTRMGGGQVNPLNGDYVFEVSEGYLIENGRLGAPVRGANLVGNGPQTLRDIDALGSDLGFMIGTCGKEGQGAPVSDAQPTLRIRELTIGGAQG